MLAQPTETACLRGRRGLDGAGAGRAGGGAEGLDAVEDSVGDGLLGGPRDRASSSAATRVTSFSALSKPIRGSETSLRTIRSAPLRASLARARPTASPPCSAAKPTIVWFSPRSAAIVARMSSVGCRFRLRLSWRLILPVIGSVRKSAGAAAISSTCWVSNRSTVSWASSAVVSTSIRLTPAGSGRLDVGRDQRHLCPAARRGGRERHAHPPARAVADEAHRVDRLAGATGRDQDPQPVPGAVLPPAPRPARLVAWIALAARQHPLDRGEQALGIGQPAATVLAARGEEALVGLDHLHPALAQRRQVGLGRGVGVHAVVHRRGDQSRRRAGEEGRGQHRVGEAAGQLGDRVGRGRGDQEGVAARGQLEVADRVVALDPGLAGEGAAHRVALELGGEDGRADDPLEGGGADEAPGVLGHQDPDAVAGQRCEARELERLVGRYPPLTPSNNRAISALLGAGR